MDNPLVEAELDLAELPCVTVGLLLTRASVGLTFGRVESVGTGVSSVGRKGALVRPSTVDRGCSKGWSG